METTSLAVTRETTRLAVTRETTILPSQSLVAPTELLCGSHNELWRPEWETTSLLLPGKQPALVLPGKQPALAVTRETTRLAVTRETTSLLLPGKQPACCYQGNNQPCCYQGNTSLAVTRETLSLTVTMETPSHAVTREITSLAVTRETPSHVVTRKTPSHVVTRETPSLVVTREITSLAVTRKTISSSLAVRRETHNLTVINPLPPRQRCCYHGNNQPCCYQPPSPEAALLLPGKHPALLFFNISPCCYQGNTRVAIESRRQFRYKEWISVLQTFWTAKNKSYHINLWSTVDTAQVSSCRFFIYCDVKLLHSTNIFEREIFICIHMHVQESANWKSLREKDLQNSLMWIPLCKLPCTQAQVARSVLKRKQVLALQPRSGVKFYVLRCLMFENYLVSRRRQ